MKGFLRKALLWLGAAFAAVIFAMVVYERFSWPQLEIHLAEFFRTLRHGDALQVISALTSTPVIALFFIIVIAGLVIWQACFRKR